MDLLRHNSSENQIRNDSLSGNALPLSSAVNNTSSSDINEWDESNWSHYAQAVAFGIGSFCATVSNCIIIIVFAYSGKLRKTPGLTHLLVLACFDLCIGVGAIAEVRAQIRAINHTPVTVAQCLAEFYLIVFGIIGSSTFLLCIAWDRACAIRTPFLYSKLDHQILAFKRALIVLTFDFALTLCQFIANDLTPQVRYCNPSVCWNYEFYMLYSGVVMCDMLIMINLYVFLLCLNHKESLKLQKIAGAAFAQRELKQQRHLTRAVFTAISVYALLFIVPNVVSATFSSLDAPPSVQMTLGCMIGLCQTINASINIVIYATKSGRVVLYRALFRRHTNEISVHMGRKTDTFYDFRRMLSYSNGHHQSTFSDLNHKAINRSKKFTTMADLQSVKRQPSAQPLVHKQRSNGSTVATKNWANKKPKIVTRRMPSITDESEME